MQRSIRIAIAIIVSFFLFFWYLVASSFFDITIATQKVFVTDGCTMFMDSTWEKCCINHDKEYWQGGNKKQRKESDVKFRKCVFESSDKKIVSQIMYGMVRISATPYIAVPWRWGYGWDFGRGYR